MEKTEKRLEYRELSGWFWEGVGAKDKALLYEHLSNLLEGGVSIIKSLDSFGAKCPNRLLVAAVENLQYFVSAGDPLSLAMKKMPDVFEKYEVAIVEAGENSGKAQSALRDLAGELRKGYDLAAKVKGALTYPTIIMVFLVLAVVVVMAFVVPRLLPLFASANVKLPMSTQVLIGVSDFFTGNWIIIAVVALLSGVGLVSLRNSLAGKAFFDGLALDLPLVGTVYRNYLMSRIAANLALLLGGGIPVVKALQLVGIISNNAAYEAAMDEVAQLVSEGKKMSESFEKVGSDRGLFTLDFVQMVESGERTSTLHVVGKRLSQQYEQEVTYSLDAMLKWVEPGAVLVAGLFVVWFAFSIYAAILQITQGVSATS